MQGQLLFNNLTVDDGLSQNSVVGIAQDSTGYLWLATLNGLNRYSGTDFVHYEKQFAYTIHPMFSKPGGLYVDRQDRLWIVIAGKLELYRPKTNDFRRIPSFSDVTKIHQAQNLDLYIGTYGKGIFKIDAETKDTLLLPKPEKTTITVLDFHEFDKKIWMACNEGIYAYDPLSNLMETVSIEGIPALNYSALEHTRDSTLWLGTSNKGLFYQSPGHDGFLPFKHKELPENLIISSLLVDSKDQLWVGTYGNGAYLYNPANKSVVNFKKERRTSFAVQYNDLPFVYEDGTEVIWIGSDGMGAYYYDPYLFKFNVLTNDQLPYDVDVGMVRSIASDPQGNIWIGTSGNGLTLINTETDNYVTYNTDNSPLSSNRVVSLMHDGTDLWIGYAGAGLNIREPSGKYLSFPKIKTYNIYGIVKKSNTESWLCTEHHGLVLFDKYNGAIEQFNTQNSKLTTDNIRTIEKGNDSIWWMGTEEKGLFRLSMATKEISPINEIPDKVKSLYFDDGILWIGTNGNGLKKYDTATGETLHFSIEQGLSDNVVYGILADDKDNLWLSSNKGITQFNTKDFKVTNHNDQVYLQFNEFNTGAYHKDKEGNLYFGGIKGINWFRPNHIKTNPYRPKTVITNVKVFNDTRSLSEEIPLKHTQNTITFTFASLQFSQPKLNHYKYRLVGYDDDWVLAGNNNEVRYTNLSPGTYSFQVVSSNYDRLWGDEPATYNFEIEQPWHFTNMATAVFTTFILQGCFIAIGLFMLLLYFRLRKQDYLLYGIYILLFAAYFFLRIDLELQTGLFWADSDSIYYFLTPIIFLVTGIFIAFVNSFAEIREHHPGFSKEIQRFALFTYVVAAVAFLYLLLTKDFTLVKDHLNLVLLPLHLYAMYAVVRAFIVVKSPLRYYILLGNIFLIGFSMVGVYYGSKNAFSGGAEGNNVFGFYSFNISQMGVFLEMIVFSLGLGHKFYLVEIEKDKIQRTDELKTKLYTDISHEIRTPLTLISGPIEHQLGRKGLSQEDKKELSLIKDNAQRLLGLVNQMLDLSMIDSGHLKLKVEKGDLRGVLVQLVEAFAYIAKEKNITIASEFGKMDDAWFDRDVVEKIVSNLLSNAVKYAPKGSQVLVNARKEQDSLVLSTVNNTNGMEIEDLGKLFNRFHQNNAASEGVGVGLALVRELVSLSQGSIIAHNIGENMIQFTLTLPIIQSAYGSNGLDKVIAPRNNTVLGQTTKKGTKKTSLLLVDDDTDILAYLVSIFKNDYTILKARNGKEGVETAMDQLPDLIISDIMMPVQNGIELCKIIKNDELTSHIPVVLLTAKAGEENQLRGLETGADAYVTKPFSPTVLKVRVEKLLENRIRLQQHYSKTFKVDPGLVPTKTETEFLGRLQQVLDKNITTPDFTSEKFSQLMHMSRSQLHKKLHAVTGMSTTEFVRTQRINLAKELLAESDASISEIAYQVGFNTPSYFNKCFKEIVGCTPIEYLSKQV